MVYNELIKIILDNKFNQHNNYNTLKNVKNGIVSQNHV